MSATDDAKTPAAAPKRLLTGDRPTGRLHLGHYVGSLANRVRLQDEYQTILIIADLHLLTTRSDRADIEAIADNARGLAIDYLAAGIDPDKVLVYLQSAVPETYELNLIFEMLITVNRLSRVPSIKDMARAAHIEEGEMPFGLLGYPVLQAADILLPRANMVPVGKDNIAHVEVTRELARRFNHLYGEVFPEPEWMSPDSGTLPGTDGDAKMSKSLDNCVYLHDTADAVRKKVRGMYTDPARVRADIPGRVEGNPVFAYLDAFAAPDAAGRLAEYKERYRAGAVGDVEVKDFLIEQLNAALEPMRRRAADYAADTGFVDQWIIDGTEKMRELARETLREVRKAMGTSGNFNKLSRAAERRRKRLGIA